MVDRSILWKKLNDMGFGGEFLAALKSIYHNDSIKAVVNGISTRSIYLGRGLRQGCSLSPLLFALYVVDMGQSLQMSKEGIKVGTVVVSCLFFADDLLLVSRDENGLLRLLSLVKYHADLIHMEINTGKDKSEIISSVGDEGDLWDVLDDAGMSVLSLTQVIRYNYLGSPVLDSLQKTYNEKQKLCISKAHKYKGSCMYVSNNGPDVVDVILATWQNVALPSILYGTEVVPFSEATIDEIEKVQSQVAKFALGVPIGTANICSQIELGMKPFRHLLYEHQLKYYLRILKLDDSRWVKQALNEHCGMKDSPYLKYICNVRTMLSIFEFPMKESKLVSVVENFFIDSINKKLAAHSLPWLLPLKKFNRRCYVQESKYSTCLAKFRYDMVENGRKYPRCGRVSVNKDCPLCPRSIRNSVSHLAMYCPSVERTRKEKTDISFFRNVCLRKGVSEEDTFSLYVNGFDWNGNLVDSADYLKRGEELSFVLNDWLLKW